jgi:uncharacterized membrane protein
MEFLIQFTVAGVVFGVIDALWLSVVANKFYKSQIGDLLLKKPNMAAAVLFYAIYLVGLIVFVIQPATVADDWQVAASLGALFGFVCYATYDLTNLATLKGFTTKLVIVDLLWGAVVSATVSVATYSIVTGWFG